MYVSEYLNKSKMGQKRKGQSHRNGGSQWDGSGFAEMALGVDAKEVETDGQDSLPKFLPGNSWGWSWQVAAGGPDVW